MKYFRFNILGPAVLMIAVAGFLFFRSSDESTEWVPVRDVAAAEKAKSQTSKADPFMTSASCKNCHRRFYELWEPSHHGKAMQVFSKKVAESLPPQEKPVAIGEEKYQYHFDGENGWVKESSPKGEKKYSIQYAIGGRNAQFFLTELAKGKLQVLPVAYDTQGKFWYDMAEAGMRHFDDIPEEAYHWTEWPFTFNTSCRGCHVSQFENKYDLKTGQYTTTWGEPGINCEACHGSAKEHVEFVLANPGVHDYSKMRIDTISQKRGFSAEAVNSNCLICHTKGGAITAAFHPGDEYFDHYDLTTLEHADFYPDGRDLGENYTYTTWLQSPCVKESRMDCIHCHTSSGRNRFEGANANQSCMPCHSSKVNNPTKHTFHKIDSEGSKCVNCHMPTTRFAAMTRSDHSMRPPMPTLSRKFKSPNACNLCHDDQTAQWADKYVREWRERDYQADDLYRADLVDRARNADWSQLQETLDYIVSDEREEVVANSLVRLLDGTSDDRKWKVLIQVLNNDSSPLIRSSAAAALHGYFTKEGIDALLKATQDKYRLVRIRAAYSLAALPPSMVPSGKSDVLKNAYAEYRESMTSRPDDAVAHYNIGNFKMAQDQPQAALESYEIALHLRPDFTPAFVNAALVESQLGDNQKALEKLETARKVGQQSDAVELNLGMLYAELKQMDEAEVAFRRALKLNPRAAQAAFNLGVLLAEKQSDEALKFTAKAWELEPQNSRYGYTHGFFLYQFKRTDSAITVLEQMVEKNTDEASVYYLAGKIYEEQGQPQKAQNVYRSAAANENLHPQIRQGFYIQSQQ